MPHPAQATASRIDREIPQLHRLAGASAVLTALLFAVGSAVWGFAQPGRSASGHTLVGFYDHLSSRIVIGGSISVIAIGACVAFAAAFRGVLVELEGNDLLGNLMFAGALLGSISGLAAETINMAAALRAGDGALTPSAGQTMFDISWMLGYNAAGVGLGLVALATGAAALRARRLLPQWLAVTAVVLGAALLTPLALLTPVIRALILLSTVLLAIIGGMLLRGAAARPR